MSCLFSFRCRKSTNILEQGHYDVSKKHERSKHNTRKNRDMDNDPHNNSVKKTTTNSQSTGTKSSSTTSNPTGVPFEIGGLSFDESDEVSLISCSTWRNNSVSFTFDEYSAAVAAGDGAADGPLSRGVKSQQRYNDWVRNGNEVRTGRYVNSKSTNLLATRENEDDDTNDNESKSHFTRVSI